MRQSKPVRLQHLIIHYLDSQRLQICDLEIPLDTETALGELVTGHVERALQDAAARTARFDGVPHEVSPLCDAMLNGQAGFVDGSRKLALRLHGLLCEDQRISAGDLVVALYHAGDGLSAFPCLALIKMDANKVFRHDYVQHADGRYGMEIIPLDQVLPTRREQLQKCACIRHTGSEYDMILLDRQIRGQRVAQFFTKAFLDARLAFDDRERTQRFYRCATTCYDTICSQLSDAGKWELRTYIRNSLKRPSLDLVLWADELPLEEPLREEFRKALALDVVDAGLEVDRTTARKLLRRKQFRGAHDLRVEFDECFNPIQEVRRIDRPGEVPKWEITLLTETWEQQ